MDFSVIDIAVFIGYCLLIVAVGLWVSRDKKGHEKDSSDYFLAGSTLPWWAVGSSLIASNISAEQFIGMSGSGYALGLGIATYEWMAAITLLVVGKFFLPIFLEKKIYTMPQFLEMRYDKRVRTSLAVYWLLVYIFVNLTSVLYLGALTLKTVMGVDLVTAIVCLAIFSLVYSIYGGLMAVAWTDVVQVVFLVFGGLVTTYIALNTLSDGAGIFSGLSMLIEKAPERFDMILDSSHPSYKDLPGISVLIGGMWIANLNYWGCNQYITQRALAAKSLSEAQRGIIFAGVLKLIMPMIVVVPGIVAFVMNPDLPKSDEAYPWLLQTFVPVGLKGLAFAALVAAVVSSLSSMTNSIATIFSMDLYKEYIKKDVSESGLVTAGRSVGVVSMIIAIAVAPFLSSLDQAFQFIQEFTGFVSPGVVAIFLLGFFWKKTTANAALWSAILSVPVSLLFKFLLPNLPFLDRMGVIFISLCLLMVGISLYENKVENPKGIELSKKLFHTDTVFNVGAIALCIIIAFLYARFW
ncbi:MAG: sodium/glucose cotransporter [Cytophagales bacterium]|nr:MAG: sodium/glucose cotransporter [Cytophagales bacterium]